MSNSNNAHTLLQLHVHEFGETRTCKECGCSFYISEKDKQWFYKKKLSLPRRCRDCRAYRRQEKRFRKSKSSYWINDEITRRFRHENEDELLHPETMTVDRLVTAITYCRTFYNPFTKELMDRASNLEACGCISNTPKEKLKEAEKFFRFKKGEYHG